MLIMQSRNLLADEIAFAIMQVYWNMYWPVGQYKNNRCSCVRNHFFYLITLKCH